MLRERRAGERHGPTVPFTTVVGGGTDGYAFDCACGIETDGSVACWGDCAEHPPVQGRITQLSVGAGHACGLDIAGTEWCWGSAFREPL